MNAKNILPRRAARALRRPLTILILVPAVLTATAAAEPLRLPDMGDPSSVTLSTAEERVLGQSVMEEVRRQLPLAQDPEINAYIQDLGTRLAAHADADLRFDFFVVDDPAVNAFALPGGYIGVNTGLVRQAESESELASVLAHEIAHVTQRHIARRIAASEGASWRNAALLVAAILIGSQNPEAGNAAAMAGMASSIQQQLNYSRRHEEESDRVGIRLLAAAGFDPNGMSRFFERLLRATRYQNRPPEYLSTHPVTESRIADSAQRARQYNGGEVFESPMFALMRAKLQVAGSAGSPEALGQLRKAAAQAKGEQVPVRRFALALALIEQDQLQEARQILQQLLQEHGEYSPYYVALAELEREAGQLDAALRHYRDGLSLYPGDLALTIGYARTLDAAGRPEQAWQELSGAVQQGPAQPALLRELARIAERAGRPVEARLAMAQHYQLSGDLPSALSQLEQILAGSRADDYQKARAAAYRETWREQLRRRTSS